eukprot:6047603-Heterocapsa_arctica.AAC.1
MAADDGCECWVFHVRRCPWRRGRPRGEACQRARFAGHLLSKCDPGVKESAAWAWAESVDALAGCLVPAVGQGGRPAVDEGLSGELLPRPSGDP